MPITTKERDGKTQNAMFEQLFSYSRSKIQRLNEFQGKIQDFLCRYIRLKRVKHEIRTTSSALAEGNQFS